VTPRLRLVAAIALLSACAPAPREPEPPRRDRAPSVATTAAPAPLDTAMPPDWDAARRQGVDFRAVGQEPGWLLDVDDGRALRYLGDYGETRLTAPAPPPDVAADGTRTWRARTGARALVVVARPTPCHDAMSGAAFTHTVTVRLDDREVRGCGQSPALGAPVVPR
jgi:uncharacterized membrane protein